MKRIFQFFLVVFPILLIEVNPSQAQWTQTGLSRTSVDAFALSASNLFAGAIDSGVYLSTDNGTSWSAVNRIWYSVNALALSGTNLFAGTSGGIFLSANNGTSWTQEDAGLTYASILALATSGTNIFAGTSGGVFLSTNNGASWTAVNSGLEDDPYNFYALAVSGVNLFSGNDAGVFLSTNNGTSWSALRTGLTDTLVRALAVSGSNLFAGFYYGGIFRSTNNGTSWSVVNSGLTNTSLNVLAVSGTNLLAGTAGGVFLSTNAGANWTSLGLNDKIIHAFVVAGSKLFAGTDDGVWCANLNWLSLPKSLTQSAPLNASVNQWLSPLIAWKADSSAETYHLQVSTDSSFESFVFSDSVLTTNSQKPGTLAASTTYYWRVSASNFVGASPWSSTWHFTTHSVSSPTLVSPSNASVNQPLSPTLSWNAAPYVSAYRLQVATDTGFSSIAFDNSTITTTSKQVSTLASNTTYYWHVMTLDSGSTSAWSSRWHFTTYTLPPTNLSPQEGNLKITLTWTASASPNIYKYKIYRGTSSPASTLHDSTTSTSYVDTGLTNGTQYFYRMTTENNQYLEGPFSSEVSSTPYNQPPITASLNSASLLNTGRALTSSITFSSSGSNDPDGTIDSTLWFVNYQLVGTQPSLTYNFGPGTSRVTLVVADNQNARDSSVAFVNRAAYVKTLGGTVYSGLSMVGSNVLYCIASGDAVYRLDSNETMIYKLQVSGSSGSSCSIAYDSTVYISSSDNDLYAFSKNATSVWAALPLGGNTSATPTVDSTLQRVYIGISNNNFLGVNRLTGAVVWNFFTSSPTSNCAVISSDRRLVFPTNDGTLYGVDLEASDAPSAPTWTFSLPDQSPTSPAIDQYGYFYFGTANGNLYAMSMNRSEQASQLWSLHLGGQLLAAPVIDANGTLYVGSTDSNMYAVNLSSKNIAWTFKTNGSIQYTAAISPAGYIYFDNDAGQLYCVDNTGNMRWSFNDPGDGLQVVGPILCNNGMVYAGAGTKSIIALYDGNGIQSSASRVSSVNTPIWGTFQGNNQRTGIQPVQIVSSVSEDNNKIPASYALYANYPNPFNPSTIISYDIPKLSQVTLVIYDVLGRQVAELVDGEKAPGSYQVTFDATGLSTGVYFYALQAGTYRDTKKFLLLK